MKIIGLMSGTSADGVDAALFVITGEPPHHQVTMLHALNTPFTPDLQRQIYDASRPETGTVDTICRLNRTLGQQFARAVIDLVAGAGLSLTDIDLIGSAGQTIWHDVAADGSVNATLQIAESSEIAEMTGVTTIGNLRTRDVAAGGHGAPLTAYVDWLLLRHPTHWRAVQNIGGIGNVTFLPPLSDTQSKPLAFDTGPGNTLIDGITALITDGAQTYDKDGTRAANGQINVAWLNDLIRTDPYYSRRPPKTTGRERYSTIRCEELLQDGRDGGLSDLDIIATVTALTAQTIADAYHTFAPAPIAEVIVGGGGTRNPTLISMLEARLGGVPIRTHEEVGMDSDNKEALVIALLAYETWHMRPGNHPALTGAAHPVVLGGITPGRNYPALIRQTWCST